MNKLPGYEAMNHASFCEKRLFGSKYWRRRIAGIAFNKADVSAVNHYFHEIRHLS